LSFGFCATWFALYFDLILICFPLFSLGLRRFIRLPQNPRDSNEKAGKGLKGSLSLLAVNYHAANVAPVFSNDLSMITKIRPMPLRSCFGSLFKCSNVAHRCVHCFHLFILCLGLGFQAIRSPTPKPARLIREGGHKG